MTQCAMCSRSFLESEGDPLVIVSEPVSVGTGWTRVLDVCSMNCALDVVAAHKALGDQKAEIATRGPVYEGWPPAS
jgi:hypothetical protein